MAPVGALSCLACAAFLDLKKAFDSLDHCILLQHISDLSVTGSVLRWFKNYLSGRVHRVKLAI